MLQYIRTYPVGMTKSYGTLSLIPATTVNTIRLTQAHGFQLGSIRLRGNLVSCDDRTPPFLHPQTGTMISTVMFLLRSTKSSVISYAHTPRLHCKQSKLSLLLTRIIACLRFRLLHRSRPSIPHFDYVRVFRAKAPIQDKPDVYYVVFGAIFPVDRDHFDS